jgi:hypothetical protein
MQISHSETSSWPSFVSSSYNLLHTTITSLEIYKLPDISGFSFSRSVSTLSDLAYKCPRISEDRKLGMGHTFQKTYYNIALLRIL